MKCPMCKEEIEYFACEELIIGTMDRYGTDWSDDSFFKVTCPECDEELDWDEAVAICEEARDASKKV